MYIHVAMPDITPNHTNLKYLIMKYLASGSAISRVHMHASSASPTFLEARARQRRNIQMAHNKFRGVRCTGTINTEPLILHTTLGDLKL